MAKERKKRTPFEKLKPFTDAQRSLMAEYYSWAMKYADTEIKRRSDKRDMIPAWVIEDAATNALIYSAVRWDKGYGVSFKTFFHNGFYPAVWNAVKEYCDSRDNHVSENTPVYGGSSDLDGDVLRLKDTIPFSDVSFEDLLCDKVDVDMLLSKLTPLQAESTIRSYFYNERQSDIARDMGVSKQNVNFAISTAIRSMRKIYNGECDRVRRGRKKKHVGTED